jgi:hypothetical protein
MAVPYVLAIHEGYLTHCCEVLMSANRMNRGVFRNLKASNVHEGLAIAANSAFSSVSLELFHVTRCMRNAHIHSGGRASTELLGVRSNLSSAAEALWTTLAKESLPAWTANDEVLLGLPQLLVTLAITNRLAIEANEAIQPMRSEEEWAAQLVWDFLEEHGFRVANQQQRMRKLVGFRRQYYGAHPNR